MVALIRETLANLDSMDRQERILVVKRCLRACAEMRRQTRRRLAELRATSSELRDILETMSKERDSDGGTPA